MPAVLQVGVVVFTPRGFYSRHDPVPLRVVMNNFFTKHEVTEDQVVAITHSQNRQANAAAAGGPDGVQQFVTVFIKGRPELTGTVVY